MGAITRKMFAARKKTCEECQLRSRRRGQKTTHDDGESRLDGRSPLVLLTPKVQHEQCKGDEHVEEVEGI